jgi:hypothetical protein
MNAGKLLAAALTTLMLSSAANAQEARKLFIEGDIVRGLTRNGATGPVCVLNSQFKRSENVVFRMRVTDVSGKPLDDKALKSIVVELSDGQKLNARYGSRPPAPFLEQLGLSGPVDGYWAAAWLIPADYPMGTLGFRYIVTDQQGNTQTWEPLKEYRSWPTIVAGAVEYSKPEPLKPPAGLPQREAVGVVGLAVGGWRRFDG